MRGQGRLNILPQKQWNVYNYENREKVRRCEEAAVRDEQLKREQARKNDAAFRLERLPAAHGLAPWIFDPIQGLEKEKGWFKRKKMKKEEAAPKVVGMGVRIRNIGWVMGLQGKALSCYGIWRSELMIRKKRMLRMIYGSSRGGAKKEVKKSQKKT